MYHQSDDPQEPADPVDLPDQSRKFAPVPLGIFSAFIGLITQFFGLFSLAWIMAPTSIGCGAPRAASVGVVQLAIAVAIFVVFSGVGLGIMGDARETPNRRRSYLITFGALYLIGSIPLIATAALFGSCFNF